MGHKGSNACLAGLLALTVGCSQPATLESDEPPSVGFDRVAGSDAVRGERLARVLGCVGCHGEDLAGRDWSDALGVLWTANLTRSAASLSDAEFEARMMTGRTPQRELHGMPSHIFTRLARADVAAVVAFVRSKPVTGEVHTEPTFGPELRKLMREGTLGSSAQDVAEHGREWPAFAGEGTRLGRYIVRATCTECHGMQLRGGEPEIEGQVKRPDLRLVASYDPEDFVALMRHGKAAGDRELGLMSEVARGRYAHLTDREIEAVRSYLVELARVDP